MFYSTIHIFSRGFTELQEHVQERSSAEHKKYILKNVSTVVHNETGCVQTNNGKKERKKKETYRFGTTCK